MKKINNDVRGVIFDFDGTLADTIPMWNVVDQMLIKQMSGTEEDLDFISEQRCNFLHNNTNGDVYQNYAQFLANKYNDAYSSSDVGELRKHFYTEYILNKAEYKKGAPEFLKYLISKNMPIALATHGKHVALDLYAKNKNFQQSITLEEAFGKNIITGDDVSNNKPHPEIYIKATEKLGIEPQSAVVFEDSLSGVMSAKNADIGTIIQVDDKGSYNDNEKILNIADFKVDNFCDAKELF